MLKDKLGRHILSIFVISNSNSDMWLNKQLSAGHICWARHRLYDTQLFLTLATNRTAILNMSQHLCLPLLLMLDWFWIT